MLDKLPVELVLEIVSHGSGIVNLRTCCRRLHDILDDRFWHYVHIEEDQCCYDFGDECYIKEHAPFSARLRNPSKESYQKLAKTKIVTISIGARDSTYNKARDALKAAFNVEWVGIVVNENELHFSQLLQSLRPEINKVISQNGPQPYISHRTEECSTIINVPNVKSLSLPYPYLKEWLGAKYTTDMHGLDRLVIRTTQPEWSEMDLIDNSEPTLITMFEETKQLRCFEWQDTYMENKGLLKIPSTVRELALYKDDGLSGPRLNDRANYLSGITSLTVDDTFGSVFAYNLPNLKELKVSGDLRFYSNRFLSLLAEFLEKPERTVLERLDLCDAFIYSGIPWLQVCPARLKTLLFRENLSRVLLSHAMKHSLEMLVLGSEPPSNTLSQLIQECPKLKSIFIDGNTRCPRKLIHKIEDRLANPTRIFTRMASPYYFDGYVWHRAVRDQIYRLDIRR